MLILLASILDSSEKVCQTNDSQKLRKDIKLATLLDISPRSLEAVIYFSSYIVSEVDLTQKAKAISSIEKDLVIEKELLNKELENKIVDYEASKGEEIRAKKGISEEEALSKIKQQVQKIRNTLKK